MEPILYTCRKKNSLVKSPDWQPNKVQLNKVQLNKERGQQVADLASWEEAGVSLGGQKEIELPKKKVNAKR